MKMCAECGVQPVRQEWATLCFDCDAAKRCPDCGVSHVITLEGEKIPCRACQLREQIIEHNLEEKLCHSRSQIKIRICPVCQVKLLHGREETCSDKCRKKLSRMSQYRERSNGKPKTEKRETALNLSSKDSKNLGEYLSRFKAPDRPENIKVDRMRSLEAGRAKVLSGEEIRDLCLVYPQVIEILFGIRLG